MRAEVMVLLCGCLEETNDLFVEVSGNGQCEGVYLLAAAVLDSDRIAAGAGRQIGIEGRGHRPHKRPAQLCHRERVPIE